MRKNFPLLFLAAGLIMLITGIVIGILISMIYVMPDFLNDLLSFNYLRPLHTTSVISWIILTAMGGIYFNIGEARKRRLYSYRLASIHFVLFVLIAIGIVLSVTTGKMGGREYLAFPPVFMVPILAGWILFGVNFFKTLVGKASNWPVYYWMWGTGIVFMIFHLSESNFWLFDFFRRDFIKDMTVQWKSYGSFVGSWNMLVYGTAIYLMAKIKKNSSVARGRLVFFFYFLGFANLMFGWAHHTYLLPTLPWVRYVAYAISMTEWIIFIRIIYIWWRSLNKESKKEYSMTYRFLIASDLWVFLNLLMALLMSIPALNYFTHGTHITVAHSMGTTIGINSMILFASIAYILNKKGVKLKEGYYRIVFYLMNSSLLIFWIALIGMGLKKAIWLNNNPNGLMSSLHAESMPYYYVFILAGILLGLSLIFMAWRMLKLMSPFLMHLCFPATVRRELEHLEKSQ